MQEFQIALRLAPDSAATHANLANLLAKQHGGDEAMAHYFGGAPSKSSVCRGSLLYRFAPAGRGQDGAKQQLTTLPHYKSRPTMCQQW